MKLKILSIAIYFISIIILGQNHKYKIYNLEDAQLNFIVFKTKDVQHIQWDQNLGVKFGGIWTVPVLESTNYPNPFSPSLTFGFVVEDCDTVKLELLDKNKKLLTIIFEEKYSPGRYSMELLENSINDGNYFLKFYKNNKNWVYHLRIN